MTDIKRLLSEDGEAWVVFKPSGYPFKLRKQLREANNDEAGLALVLPYVVSIHIPTISGSVLEKLTMVDDLADVEEKTAAQIIYQFYEFRGERNYAPIPKNSSPPSQDT